MEPVRVLGAGPSGLAAAITLARAGRDVEVFDSQTSVGSRFNGDLQGLENWSGKTDVLSMLASMDIDVNFDISPFSHVTVGNGIMMRRLSFRKPLFYLIKRGPLSGSLDQGLKRQAIKAGARLRLGITIPKERADIIATGPRKSCVVGAVRGITFRTSSPDQAIVIANRKVAYRGYSYLLVTGGYGCMCTVVMKNLDAAEPCYQETRKLFYQMTGIETKDEKPVGGVGSFSSAILPFMDGKKLVGEAAGLQDFMWGFGTRCAITSGFLAAKSIIHRADYGAMLRKAMIKHHRSGVVNRFLWEAFSTRTPLFLHLAVRHPRPMGFLRSFHSFNTVQKLIYPVALPALRRRYPQIR